MNKILPYLSILNIQTDNFFVSYSLEFKVKPLITESMVSDKEREISIGIYILIKTFLAFIKDYVVIFPYNNETECLSLGMPFCDERTNYVMLGGLYL